MKTKDDLLKMLDAFCETYTIEDNTIVLRTEIPLLIRITFERMDI